MGMGLADRVSYVSKLGLIRLVWATKIGTSLKAYSLLGF